MMTRRIAHPSTPLLSTLLKPLLLTLLTIPLVALAACGGGGDDGGGAVGPSARVASVIVTPAATTLRTGATAQLTAQARDGDGATLSGRTLTWSSASDAIATVSSAGVVTAVEHLVRRRFELPLGV